MKKRFLYIALFSLLLAGALGAYIWGGEKSLPFRLSLFALVAAMALTAALNYKDFTAYFKKGKAARGRLLEACALAFFFTALLAMLKSFDANIDWTSRGLFRLSAETKEILTRLPKESPVQITLFYYQDSADSIGAVAEYGRKLAQRYGATSTAVQFREINPLRDKVLADEHGVQQNGTFVFEMEGRREYIAPTLLVESFQEGEILYKGETIFSAAIDKLQSNQETTLYFLTGNGELDWASGGARGYDGIYTALKDRRYKLAALNLDHNPSLPEDANLLVIGDPRSPLSEASINSIERHMDMGGAVLFLLSQNTTEDLNILLLRAGFAYINNVALDPSRVAKNSGDFSIIPDLSPKSDITRLLRSKNLAVVFPSSSAFATLPQEMSDTNFLYDISPLARSTGQGFGETAFKTGRYQRDENDIPGPLILAASSIVASKKTPELQNRFAVFGSTEFIDNNSRFLGGNTQFFLNTVDFLLQKDLKTSVAPKTENLQLSIPSPQQSRSMFALTLIWAALWFTAAATVLLIRKNMTKKS